MFVYSKLTIIYVGVVKCALQKTQLFDKQMSQIKCQALFLKKNKKMTTKRTSCTTILSTSLGKTAFAWHFISNENILS